MGQHRRKTALTEGKGLQRDTFTRQSVIVVGFSVIEVGILQ